MASKKRKVKDDTKGASSSSSSSMDVPSKSLTTVTSQWLSNSKVTKEFQSWLSACPNIDELKNQFWLETKQPCYECQERYKRRDLRADIISPHSQGHLICKTCWDFFLHGMVTTPRIDWPVDDVPHQEKKTSLVIYDGILVNKKTKVRVGVVKNYNPTTRCGKVTLDEFPDCGELGIIDPNDEVIPDPKSKKTVITQHNSDDDGSGSDSDS